ncbi:MAG: alpha/beta fold hydrolase, partial [Burkholderiaceae bacterium]
MFVEIRGLRYHLRKWGSADANAARTLVMLHGWMDVSASFQFVADALDESWRIVAPDWRGYGLTERARADCYWFPDYLADLDFILDHVVGAAPAVLVGHSMGGNIALMYAGVRPQRVRAVVNLEGFGLRATHAEEAPARYAQWIDELRRAECRAAPSSARAPVGGGRAAAGGERIAGASLRDYDSLDEVAARLIKNNPRLSAERGAFLAQHWALSEAGRY